MQLRPSHSACYSAGEQEVATCTGAWDVRDKDSVGFHPIPWMAQVLQVQVDGCPGVPRERLRHSRQGGKWQPALTIRPSLEAGKASAVGTAET